MDNSFVLINKVHENKGDQKAIKIAYRTGK